MSLFTGSKAGFINMCGFDSYKHFGSHVLCAKEVPLNDTKNNQKQLPKMQFSMVQIILTHSQWESFAVVKDEMVWGKYVI